MFLTFPKKSGIISIDTFLGCWDWAIADRQVMPIALLLFSCFLVFTFDTISDNLWPTYAKLFSRIIQFFKCFAIKSCSKHKIFRVVFDFLPRSGWHAINLLSNFGYDLIIYYVATFFLNFLISNKKIYLIYNTEYRIWSHFVKRKFEKLYFYFNITLFCILTKLNIDRL